MDSFEAQKKEFDKKARGYFLICLIPIAMFFAYRAFFNPAGFWSEVVFCAGVAFAILFSVFLLAPSFVYPAAVRKIFSIWRFCFWITFVSFYAVLVIYGVIAHSKFSPLSGGVFVFAMLPVFLLQAMLCGGVLRLFELKCGIERIGGWKRYIGPILMGPIAYAMLSYHIYTSCSGGQLCSP